MLGTFFLVFTIFSFEPLHVHAAVGDVVPLRACFWLLNPPRSEAMRVVSRAPDVAFVSGSKPADTMCGEMRMTAVAPGLTILDVFLDGRTDPILNVDVAVEGCDAFPQVPALTVIRAQAGAPVTIVPAIVADASTSYAWYAGELGDRSHLVGTASTLVFTAAEPRRYPLWVEVRNGCGSKAGVVIVDAALERRRAAR
jgi:hypothetical protein